MSWKGTKKTFERLPQNFRVKTGLGTVSRDADFDTVLSRFNELLTGTEKLYKDAIKFRDSVSHMLNHQSNISDLLIELYNPIIGKHESDSTVRRVTTPVQSMKAVEEFNKIMSELREILLPELDRVDEMVVLPSKDFIDIVNTIKKTIKKRDHKRTDFDRYTNSVKKLQNKKEKSSNEEKTLIKEEEHLTKATEEYEYYNELLKKELPHFYEYRAQFIQPIVTNFYHLQLKIYRVLYEKMDELVTNTGYFDAESDIAEHYNERIAEVNHQIESQLTLLENKKKKLKKESDTNDEPTGSNHTSTNHKHDNEEDAPPAYSPTPSASTSNSKLYPVQKKAPPLPPSKPKSYVRALYDYDAQADGDLSFRKDDKIEVINRTSDANDWWKGKLNGITGDFPGNYVEDW